MLVLAPTRPARIRACALARGIGIPVALRPLPMLGTSRGASSAARGPSVISCDRRAIHTGERDTLSIISNRWLAAALTVLQTCSGRRKQTRRQKTSGNGRAASSLLERTLAVHV